MILSMKLRSFSGLLLIVGYALMGCEEKAINDEDVHLMAELQCEARHLKDERFGKANELRFRNDSLMKLNIPLTEAQKQEEDSIRNVLTIRTGEVAVRLTRTMDSLFDIHYKTVERRQEFDTAVEKKLKEICE